MSRPIYLLMKKAMCLITKKGADYSDQQDWHSNFKYAEYIAGEFPMRYKTYAVLIGVKLARLSQLLQEGRRVHNEAIEDSFLDLINYCALMAERYAFEQHLPVSTPTESAQQAASDPTLWSITHQHATRDEVSVRSNTL